MVSSLFYFVKKNVLSNYSPQAIVTCKTILQKLLYVIHTRRKFFKIYKNHFFDHFIIFDHFHILFIYLEEEVQAFMREMLFSMVKLDEMKKSLVKLDESMVKQGDDIKKLKEMCLEALRN